MSYLRRLVVVRLTRGSKTTLHRGGCGHLSRSRASGTSGDTTTDPGTMVKWAAADGAKQCRCMGDVIDNARHMLEAQ